MAIPLDKYSGNLLADIISQMIKAIDEAIAAQLCPIHTTAVCGELCTTRGGFFYYKFQLGNGWQPKDSTVVQVQIDSERAILGTILCPFNSQIILATETPLPHAVLRKTNLYEATSWLLGRLKDALLKLQKEGEMQTCMGAKVLNLLPSIFSRGKRKVQIAGFHPDSDQVHAIDVGLGSERLILISPPGTDVTATEAALLLEYLRAGKTVLLITSTNTVLDTILKRLKDYCEMSENTHLLKEHRLIRLGPSQCLLDERYLDLTLQSLVDQHLGTLARIRDLLRQQQSDLEDTLTHLSRTLDVRRQQWMKQRNAITARLTTVRQACTHLEELEQQRLATIAARLEVIAKERQAAQEKQLCAEQEAEACGKMLPTYTEKYKACGHELQLKKSELDYLQSSSLTSRFLSRLLGVTKQTLIVELEGCQADFQEISQVLQDCKQRQKEAHLCVYRGETQRIALDREEEDLRRSRQRMTREARRIDLLRGEIRKYEQMLQEGEDDIAVLEEKFVTQQQSLRQMRERLKEIDNVQQAVTSRIISEAKLIGTTFTNFLATSCLWDRQFDVVANDETSMASLALLLVVSVRAIQHVVLIGDPLQLLPAITLKKKKNPLATYWLGTNLFSHSGMTFGNSGASTNGIVLLSNQLRMLPEIASPISQFIYGGVLKNRRDPHRIPFRFEPYPERPLILVDTSDVDRDKYGDGPRICSARRLPRSTSIYNLYHVECVVQLVSIILSQLSILRELQIGVITPYDAQMVKICQALRAHKLLEHVHVGTIARFQSLEYSCIIFDTTEGYGVPIGQFISNAWGHHGLAHEATRLINIAHSCARDKLIYIANVDYIRQEPYRKEHLLTKFISHVCQQGYIASRQVLNLNIADD